MLRVLSHYLPIRKALLIASETVLLTAVLVAGLTVHLWRPTSRVLAELANEIPALSLEAARLRCTIAAVAIAVLAQIAIAFNELYDVRVSSSRFDRAARFVESAGSALGLALLAVLLGSSTGGFLDLPGLTLSQRMQTLIFSMLLGFALLYGWRTFCHYLLRRASFNERVLILGTGKAARELAREIRERPDSGFHVVGLYAEDGGGRVIEHEEELLAVEPAAARAGANPLPARGARLEAAAPAAAVALAATAPAPVAPAGPIAPIGPISDGEPSGRGSNGDGHAHGSAPRSLYDVVRGYEVDQVVVALEDRRRQLPTEDLLRCRLGGIPVREQEELYEHVTGKIAVEAMRPSYLIFNEGFARHPWTDLAKRAIDVALAAAALLATWPLMVLTAIAVRLDSPGPILFSQQRVGRDGAPFTLHKFRSMRADAEKLTGPVWATEDDPRVTRAGRFIRRARLDELPQLFNVIAGDMSMVGPRPERPTFVDELARVLPYYAQRHIVKPGITGWAQINYPYGSTVEDALRKLQYDLFYIKNQSVLFNVSILFNTVKTVILRKGT